MSIRVARVRAAVTLRRAEMPRAEIRAILAADDPGVVRRYLELHRERLEEELADRRRILVSVERSLTDALREPVRGPAGPDLGATAEVG
jgi:hypothetical protein